ncbi:hypothetical protein V1481_02165 [Aeromonas enteropelogenes]|uniref:hypothetical protein n=1 Tax=Aeromonas TaxID=642 RepID=UPI0005A6B5BE|nr:hypothetical protein [Aeromonas enteropelogenes]UBH57059.1 hypothetical protein LA341_03835 [Aeromonas enteropelogenes]
MWILLAIGCMVLALKVFNFSFTLALIPFFIGCLCFGRSNQKSLENFMAFSFLLALVGLVLNLLISMW